MTQPLSQPTTIDQMKQRLVADITSLGNWQNRYAYLIDMGKHLIAHNQHVKSDANQFYGCQANVWLQPSIDDKTIRFEGFSDSVIVAGLMALLFKVYSGRQANEIISTSTDFIEEMDLLSNLTSQRSTGLMLMVEKMKEFAEQNAQ